MRKPAEIAVFGGLAVALHVAAFATMPPAGAESQGAGGEALVSLAGASQQIAAMVQEWDAPPDVTAEVQDTPPPPAPQADALPEVPATDNQLAAPVLPPSLDMPEDVAETPAIDTDTAPPPSAQAVTSSQRPETRPERAPAPQPQNQPARAEQRAAGSGGGGQAGQSSSANASTLSPGRAAELQAVWGAQIRSRIERRKRYPRGARGSGAVMVALTVSRSGQLVSVNLRQSSGTPAFDQAALSAVSSAGRFPAAPDGLGQASYAFTLQLNFSR